jgi:Holliday junction resolvase RusA-like endonuclease|tara:strand:- start:776 stop:1198 length:423 start_codon:yes stop_codon:yes gene_type:complete
MRITFDIDPIPASRPRVSRWSTYYPKRYTKFREKMKALTGELETTPFEKLVSVSVVFYIGMPKSWSKKKKKEKNKGFCDNNADLDNYQKAILDSLNGVLYIDDRQIVEIFASKRYSDKPFIELEIHEIGEENDCREIGNV